MLFNLGNTQEFKNQVFFYVNIHGETPAFPAVALFSLQEDHVIFDLITGFDWFRSDYVVLLSVIQNGKLYIQKQPPELFCKIVVPKYLTYLINFP